MKISAVTLSSDIICYRVNTQPPSNSASGMIALHDQHAHKNRATVVVLQEYHYLELTMPLSYGLLRINIPSPLPSMSASFTYYNIGSTLSH